MRIIHKKSDQEYAEYLEKMVNMYKDIISEIQNHNTEDMYYVEKLVVDVLKKSEEIVCLKEIIGKYSQLLKLVYGTFEKIEEDFKQLPEHKYNFHIRKDEE